MSSTVSLEELLAPVSPEKPCGPDPSPDTDFRRLDVIIQGKPETVLSKEQDKAEEPNWGELEESCLAVFSRSKHLHVAVALSLAMLKLRGVPGFRDGVATIRGLLEQYWYQVHPQLDADDNNDPTERVNILESLCAPPGTFGDRMNFVNRLRQAPLCRSRNGSISASDIVNSETKAPGAKPLTEIAAAFAVAKPEEIQANYQALADTLLNVKEIDAFLNRTAGNTSGRSWNTLVETLEDMQRRLTRYAPVAAVAETGSEPVGEIALRDQGGLGGTSPISGAVQSRKDVSRVLDMLCDYYRSVEPSSPIPLLLRRAQRLVDKDFMQIISQLTPDAIASLRIIIGEESAAENRASETSTAT
jgi:type VI secretion system protein ImpA